MAAQIIHFTHRHPLRVSGIADEQEDICSGCELDLSGPSYACTKPDCGFFLHQSCSDLPQTIKHKSHPKHHLSLLISPPYPDAEFMCNGCCSSGHGFTYHCSVCQFDLHVQCASLPETLEDLECHKHPLRLFFSSVVKEEIGMEMRCGVCEDWVSKKGWVYCCLGCKFAAHLECPAS